LTGETIFSEIQWRILPHYALKGDSLCSDVLVSEIYSLYHHHVGFEVLAEVVMKSSIFCSPLKVNLHFGGTCRLNIQDRSISQARNQSKCRWQGEPQIQLSCWFLAWFILRPWRWRRRAPQKRRLTFNEPHGVIFQTLERFTSSHYDGLSSWPIQVAYKDLNTSLNLNFGRLWHLLFINFFVLVQQLRISVIGNVTKCFSCLCAWYFYYCKSVGNWNLSFVINRRQIKILSK
jgi:hypothetical protein